MKDRITFVKKGNTGLFDIVADNNYKGYAELIEMNKRIKSITMRLVLNKDTENSVIMDILTKLYKKFMSTGDIYKVNLVVGSDINIAPFTRLGFSLQGILFNNDNSKSRPSDEYLFGADSSTFKIMDEISPIVIQGENIEMRLAMPSDGEKFLKYYQDNRDFLRDFEPAKDENFYTLDFQNEDLRFRYSQYLKGQSILFGIYYENELIGKMRINDIVYGSIRSCELGYALHKDYVNRGYMQEVMELTKKFCFEDLGLHRIEAYTIKNNEPSQRVLEKCGFKNSGFIESYLNINREWKDCYLYSIYRN